MGIGQCGVCSKGSSVRPLCLGRSCRILEKDSEVECCEGIVGLETQCFPVTCLRLPEVGARVGELAQVHVSRTQRRVEGQGLSVCCLGFLRGGCLQFGCQVVPLAGSEA